MDLLPFTYACGNVMMTLNPFISVFKSLSMITQLVQKRSAASHQLKHASLL